MMMIQVIVSINGNEDNEVGNLYCFSFIDFVLILLIIIFLCTGLSPSTIILILISAVLLSMLKYTLCHILTS